MRARLCALLLASLVLAQQQQQQHQYQPCEQREREKENHVTCRIRTTKTAAFVLEQQLTTSGLHRITHLHLQCSKFFLFESVLTSPPDFLVRTERLVELKLDQCKIKRIPSNAFSHLHHLRTLSINTYNVDWSSMMMELESDTFTGLQELRHLDLSNNNIWTLSQNVFCPLRGLKMLNLTINRIQNMTQLGFDDPNLPCNSALEVLDLSKNDIISIPDDALSSLRSLTHLHLQQNAISSISDGSLAGLASLQTLDMSSNFITSLPPELFRSSKDVKHVYFTNNTLGVLAPGVFDGLDQLLVLDLSHNELTSRWVNRDTFVRLVRTVVLNLAHNLLTKIDSATFRDLYSLQILSLEYNKIETVAEDAFSELKNLHALTLSHNNLKIIGAHHFSRLYMLNKLFLDHNSVSYIHERAFENVTNLQDLSVNDNELQTVPVAVKNLRVLESLDLGKNNISVIYNTSFEGLNQLFGLRLVDNMITNILPRSFVNLPSLQVLNLASNEIKTVARGAFNANMKAIRLDGNKLKDITGMFSDLKRLMWLNISDNRVDRFDYNDLPDSLEWLDIHSNEIRELPPCAHTKSVNLKTLDASYNRLKEISDAVVPNTIESLFVNNNNISQIEPGTFVEKSNLQKVYLYGNNIRTMDIGALALSPVADGAEVAQFYISGNPYKCDCKMEWLQRINQLVHTRQYPRVMDLEMVSCSLTHSRGITTKPVLEMKSSQFLCPYENHCFALCHCCEFDACDCEMICPSNCSCYHDMTWTANVVDCSNAGYTEVPTKIPMDATEIYLDGNNLKELGSHVFIGKKKLQVLYLNNSNLHNVHNRTFKGVESLKVLHLENNKLQELRGDEFDQLHNLNELYLDHNGISRIGNDTFKAMKNLEVLRLDENKIVNFEPWQLLASSSGSLSQVSLEGNKWSCDCSNIVKLDSWLRNNPGDPEKMFCSYADKNRNRETIASVLNRCSNYMEDRLATSVEQREVLFAPTFIGQNYISIFAGVFIAIVIVCMFGALVFAFRQDVRLWAHSKYGVRLFKDNTTTNIAELDADRLYDAYIIYSVKDEDFVTRAISSELEQNGYSVCLHYRDIHMMTGNSYLADSVASTTDASKRIIMVLTINFLTLEWMNHDLRTSILSTLKGLRVASKSNKIIFVLTTDVSALNLDTELQLYLRSHGAFYWGEKRFWEKLRFAMPDLHISDKTKRLPPPPIKSQTLKSLPPDVKKSPNLRYTAAPSSYVDPLDQQHRQQRFNTCPGVRGECGFSRGDPDTSCSYNVREHGYSVTAHGGRTYFV